MGYIAVCAIILFIITPIGWAFKGPEARVFVSKEFIDKQAADFVAKEKEFKIPGFAHAIFRTVRVTKVESTLGHEHIDAVAHIAGMMTGGIGKPDKPYTAVVTVSGRPELKGTEVHLKPDSKGFKVSDLRYDDKTIAEAVQGKFEGLAKRYFPKSEGLQNLAKDMESWSPDALPALASFAGEKFLKHRPVHTFKGIGWFASWAVTGASVQPEGAYLSTSLLKLMFFMFIAMLIVPFIVALAVMIPMAF
jgi:hypothetical protein